MGYTSTWISSLSQIRGAVPTSLPQGLPLPSFTGPLSSYGMPHVCQYNAVGATGYPVQWVGISGTAQQSVVVPAQSGGLFQPGMNLQAFPASPIQNPASIPPGPKWIQIDAETRGEDFHQNTYDTKLSSWVLPYFLSFESTFNCVFCCSSVIFGTAHHSVVMCTLHIEYSTQMFFTSNPILFDTWFLKNTVQNALISSVWVLPFPGHFHVLLRSSHPTFLCCYQQLYNTFL